MEQNFGVAVKAIMKNEDGKYLILVKSASEDINPDEIDLPGGRVKFGESAEECLVREVREETGLEIKVGRPLRVWNLVKENLHLVGITFTAQLTSGSISLSGEHVSYKWMTKEEILGGDYPEWIKEEFGAC